MSVLNSESASTIPASRARWSRTVWAVAVAGMGSWVSPIAPNALIASSLAANPKIYGLIGPVGPVPQPCQGVALYPTDDVVAVVAGAQPGSTFCFHKGNYALKSPIIPRSNDSFVGEIDGRVILSGNDVTASAIRGTKSGATGVRIAGLVVEYFSETGIDARSSAGTNWVLENNELRYNGWSGAEPAQITRNNYIHHNGVVGLEGGYASDGMLIENNELAFNNTQRQYTTGDNGGAKFIRTTRLKVLHNYSHDNDGAGLWTDGNNVFTEYAFNRIENNGQSGLTHEVSCDATIHDNVFRNNNTESSLWQGGEIYVHSSPNVEVFGNEISTQGNGVVLRDSIRPKDDELIQQCAVNAAAFRVRGVRVRENRIAQAGQSGMVGDRSEAFTRAHAQFAANHYVLRNVSGQHWQWGGDNHDWRQWRAIGQDSDGSVAAQREGS